MTLPNSLRLVTLACAVALVAAACTDQKAPVADSTAAAITVPASAADTVKVQGRWSDSVTATSDYQAEYVNGKLVVIEEQMLFTDSTTSALVQSS